MRDDYTLFLVLVVEIRMINESMNTTKITCVMNYFDVVSHGVVASGVVKET